MAAAATAMRTQLAGGVVLPARPVPHPRLVVAAAQQTTETSTKTDADEIYIGFPKNDYAPRAGRKGRVVKDDPAKYPSRDNLGPLLSVVGGWAGGEAGLWQLRDQIKAEESSSTDSVTTTGPKSPLRQPVKSKWQSVKPAASTGQDAIYVGFGKDELDLRKSGVQGRVIYDEAYKYPDREDKGFFKGVVGGFAGGEPVLKEFAATGELKLRKPGQVGPAKKQFSPLILAFLIIFAAAGGGVLLTTAFDLGDSSVQQLLQVTPAP